MARRYTPSEKARILEYAADQGITATAEHRGRSRFLDEYSRFVVGHGVDEAKRVAPVLETFEQAVTRHGKPEMVLHDKGSAFWSWRGICRFTALLTELGTDQILAEHKEWNGKLE